MKYKPLEQNCHKNWQEIITESRFKAGNPPKKRYKLYIILGVIVIIALLITSKIL